MVNSNHISLTDTVNRLYKNIEQNIAAFVIAPLITVCLNGRWEGVLTHSFCLYFLLDVPVHL